MANPADKNLHCSLRIIKVFKGLQDYRWAVSTTLADTSSNICKTTKGEKIEERSKTWMASYFIGRNTHKTEERRQQA